MGVKDSKALEKFQETDTVKWTEGAEIHVQMSTGTKLSGIIRKDTEEWILLYLPGHEQVILVRKKDVSLASNKAIWI